MPPQQGVRSYDAGEAQEAFSSDGLTFERQSAALNIIEPRAFPQLLFEHTDYRAGWRMGQPKFSAGIGAFPKNAFFQQAARSASSVQAELPDLAGLRTKLTPSFEASREDDRPRVLVLSREQRRPALIA